MRSLHPLRSFIVEVKRRRVMHVAAIYGGVSFAILEGTDLLTEKLFLSPAISVALAVLIVTGFPIALVVGWIFDIDSHGRLARTPHIQHPSAEARDVPERFSWPVRLAATVIGVTLVTASGYAAVQILNAEGAVAPGWVAMPIGTGLESPENLELAHQAAKRLNWQLTGWAGVRATASHDLGGVREWQGLEGFEPAKLDQAYRMADSLEIGSLVSISVDVRGDSVDLEAIIYDVRGQRRTEAIIQSGSKLDLDYLVAPVARHILGLNNQDASIDDLKSESPYPIALKDFQEGLTALYEWRLEAAEEHFRAAIDVDSLFARATHYLAVTLFWQTARDPHRIVDVGHEILRLTQTVDSLAKLREIRSGWRSHMEAFGTFWGGDYSGARSAYLDIVEQNGNDTEAWLLLGSVEYHDPMLVGDAAGVLVPRQSLNEARKAFERAAELSPLWQLSHGSLTDINRDLLIAARFKQCPAFELPDGRSWAPWEVAIASDQVGFCPLLRDSIVWVDPDAVDEEIQRQAVAGAEALDDRYRRSLEVWLDTHPGHARPYDEMANWLAEQHSTLSCKADSTVIRDGVTEILRLRQASLGLRSDTTREDLIRLAVLHLALDSIDSARTWLDAALHDLPEETAVADQAANVLLATGMPERALAITEPVWSTWTLSTTDPEPGGGSLPMGDIARPVMELRAYGATGRGPQIDQAFEALISEWSGHGFSQRQAVQARKGLLPWIQPALTHSAEARARWFDGWDEAGVEIPAVWRGFLAADAAAGIGKPLADLDAALDEVLDRLEGDDDSSMTSHFLAALLAQLAGRHVDAIEQLNFVESCPTVLDRQSSTWGLRTLGRWHRAQSYDALGDIHSAQQALADYAVLRADSGPVH